MNYTDQVTARLAKKIPKGTVDIKFEWDCVRYLHPTKGWRRVAYRRMGIKLSGPSE